MIKTFRCRDTAALFTGHVVRRWPQPLQRVSLRKLIMLDHAVGVNDLRNPPGNRLEKLSGDREGQWSIRINNQWRLCFRFEEGDAYDVEIVDYH